MKKYIYIYAIALILPAFNAFAGTFNDEQIVAIIQAFNKAEISAGDLARSTSNHSETRRFGHRMVGEHYGANWLINDLVQKEKISPENSETSESLKTNGEKYLEKLKGLRGSAFDIAYIDHEVTDHQQALSLFDNKLIPSAKNEELKHLLAVIRSWIAGHLEHAQIIQKSLGG